MNNKATVSKGWWVHLKNFITTNTCADNDSKEILEKITQSVDGFVKHADQSDDLTMLVIRYRPKQFESMLTETLVLKNDVHEVTRFGLYQLRT